MLKRLVVMVLLTPVLAGCQYDNVRVHSYWGTSISRPAAGSVYEWSAESGHLEVGQDVRLAQAIQEDIENEMAAMGYIKRAGESPPDLLLSLHTGRGLQPSPSGPEQRATLSVQVFWAADGHLMYCATADALIEPSLSPEERRARLARAIHEIMRPIAPCGHRQG
jgi:hypothetical protein